jgi:hypothetical protein
MEDGRRSRVSITPARTRECPLCLAASMRGREFRSRNLVSFPKIHIGSRSELGCPFMGAPQNWEAAHVDTVIEKEY